MWETCGDLYTHLGMFYCRFSSIWKLSAPAFLLLTVRTLVHPLLRTVEFHVPMSFQRVRRFPCKLQLLISFDLARFASLLSSSPNTIFHSHSHSHSFWLLAFVCSISLFFAFDYYCYCYCSFVIWSRAKYWIRHKWYYFMLYCVSHSPCYWDVWTGMSISW